MAVRTVLRPAGKPAPSRGSGRPARKEKDTPLATAPEPAPRRPGRRRSILLAVAALLLLVLPPVLAGYRSAQQPPTYAAQADIVYTPTVAADTEVFEREMATQEQLLLNRNALGAAGQLVGLSAAEVAERVQVEALEGSDLIRVRVEDGSASDARRITESLVTQYTDRVSARAAERAQAQQAAVDERIGALDRRLIEISDRIRVISAGGAFAPPPLQAEQRSLETEAEVLREQISSLQQEALRRAVENPSAGMPTAEVLVPAAPLAEPVGPQPMRAVAGGALLGMLLAFLLLAFTRTRHPAGAPEAAPRP